MIVRNGGKHANLNRADNVGRIKPSTQTDLHNNNVALLFGKIGESHSRHKLEFGRVASHSLCRILHLQRYL